MRTICEVVGARKAFGAVWALDGIDLAVREGEILGVVGPNGSGKTTLFNCMSGHLRLTSGKVVWLGEEVTRWPMHRIARAGLIRTFQQSMYFASGSIRENIAMAMDIAGAHARKRDALRSDVDGLVEFVGLGSVADRPTGALAHGQLRRLGIAMALACRPICLLLDEPAAGLTMEDRVELIAVLRQVRDGGVTITVVDHDMSFVMPLVDRVAVLAVGKKIAEGSPGKVRDDPRVREVYLGHGLHGAVGDASSSAMRRED